MLLSCLPLSEAALSCHSHEAVDVFLPPVLLLFLGREFAQGEMSSWNLFVSPFFRNLCLALSIPAPRLSLSKAFCEILQWLLLWVFVKQKSQMQAYVASLGEWNCRQKASQYGPVLSRAVCGYVDWAQQLDLFCDNFVVLCLFMRFECFFHWMDLRALRSEQGGWK